jgi:hypothetical protein
MTQRVAAAWLCLSLFLIPSASKLARAAQPGAAPAQAPAISPLPSPAQAPAACTQTIMVPQMTYKTMTVMQTVCKPVVRQQTVTACRLVPQTETAMCRTTVMVPEQRTRPICYTAHRLTFEDVTRDVTVMVSHKEVQQTTRTICKLVETQATRAVTKDVGGWVTKSFVDCCGCSHDCNVWQPKLVTEQVQCTVFKPQLVEEPCTIEKVVCRPEVRQFTQRVAKPVHETITRNITCTVAVPKVVDKQVTRTTYRPVFEKRVVNVTEMVPTQVERQVSVPVCTLVPKVIPCPAGCCGL